MALDVKKAVLMFGVIAALVGGGLIWANRPAEVLPPGARADLLVVSKAARSLDVYSHGVLIGSFRVSLGRDPVGAKTREGDRKTPEGHYFIDHHNPGSAYHLALHVSYPSAADAVRARTAGYAPGGDIMIHGIRNGAGWLGRTHRLVDWTVGCIAVTDPEMDQIYAAVPDGTPIEIRP